MTKKTLPLLVAALMLPGVALAKGPSPRAGTHPNQSSKGTHPQSSKGTHPQSSKGTYPQSSKGTHPNQSSNARVMYVLKGTVTDTNPTGPVAPSSVLSITFTISHSNRHARVLIGNTTYPNLTVNVKQNTKLRLKHGLTMISTGDRIMVKVQAPRYSFKDAKLANEVYGALNNSTAFQIKDWGQQPAS